MRNRNIYLVSLLLLAIVACKKWDDHIASGNPALTEDIFQVISKRSDLSKFAEYLVKTGMDKVISSSKTYTVWAPTNTALQSLDAGIVSDSVKLKQFVTNHISNQSYFRSMAQPGFRVPVLNGKRISFPGSTFDEANIVEADNQTKNGVLHVIDKAILPMQNIWEYVEATSSQFKQNAFIKNQVYKALDLSGAIVDSISSSGNPVYKPGTDSALRNRFNDQVFDLKNEEKLYTYFVLHDTSFTRESDSLKTYYKTGTTDSTQNLAYWNVSKDIVVEGFYSINELPDTLVSKFGVKIPINKNAIIATKKVSNGVVYVMSRLDFKTQDKIPAFVVQGENPTSFYPDVDRRSLTFYRVRKNPVTGQTFTDIEMTNIAVNSYYIRYRVRGVPSTKYKVYWVAVNDLGTAFMQRLAMGTPTTATFPYQTIQPNTNNNYNEVLLGEYTVNNYGDLDMYLTSAANTSATVTNSLVLDYIKLVPSN